MRSCDLYAIIVRVLGAVVKFVFVKFVLALSLLLASMSAF